MNFSHINPYDAYRHQLQQIADRIGNLTKRKLTVYMIVNEPDWWLKVTIDARHSMDERLGIGTEAFQRLAEMHEAALLQQKTLAELHEYIVRPPYPDTLIKFTEPVRESDKK